MAVACFLCAAQEERRLAEITRLRADLAKATEELTLNLAITAQMRAESGATADYLARVLPQLYTAEAEVINLRGDVERLRDAGKDLMKKVADYHGGEYVYPLWTAVNDMREALADTEPKS